MDNFICPKWDFTTHMGVSSLFQDYQDALGSAKEEEQKAKRELEDLRREMKAESIGAKEASHQILMRKDDTIKKQVNQHFSLSQIS